MSSRTHPTFVVLFASGAAFTHGLAAQEPATLEVRVAPTAAELAAPVLESLHQQELAFQRVPGHEGLFNAPARGLGVSSQVSAVGLELFARTPEAPTESEARCLLLGTKSYGRSGDVRPLSGVRLEATGRRVELDHGSLVEWFESSAQGIEHGWTIAQRQPGSELLWIGLEVQGELAFRVDEGARSATIVDGRGETRLRYLDLRAFDATGRALDASLRPSPDGLGICIDDARAVYPLVIDPLLTGPQWTAEGNQAGASFGYSVAPAGDVNGDGYCDVLIGAPFFDNGQADEGRALLYLGSATGLASIPAWTAEIDQAGAEFGHSVALAGDVNGDGYGDVIIGAPGYDNGQTDEGGAFVYLGSASGLASTPAWSVESNQASGGPNHPTLFGDAVATAGDVNGDGFSDVLVGASAYDNGESDEGRAFLYLGSSSGLNTTPAWTAESDQVKASFACAVATAGDVNGDGYEDVLIGAELFANGQTDEGRAFLFLGSASGLQSAPAWTAEGDQVGAHFGAALSTAGDMNGDRLADVVIGAPRHDGGQTDEGRVAFYLGSTGVSPLTTWTSAEAGQTGAQLGISVGTAGDLDGDGYGDVLAGGELFDSGSVDAGMVRVFYGGPNGLAATLDIQGTQSGAHLGHSVNTAGDVNGDGFSDLVLGEVDYTNGQSSEGRALAYLGRQAGFGPAPNWVVPRPPASGSFGSVTCYGDVNGDGYADLLVGASGYTNGELAEGGVYLYLGGPAGPPLSPSLVLESNVSNASFGESLSTGDVNGDGFSDVLIGAPGFTNGQSNEGRAYLYLGSAAGLSSSPAWTAESDNALALFGSSAACAGDVNGDGFGDVVIGAPKFSGGQTNEGRAFAYLGTRTGLPSTPSWSFELDQSLAKLGTAVTGAGDVNGDGFSDVLVSAPYWDHNYIDEGVVLEFSGSKSGLSATPDWVFEGYSGNLRMGLALACANDVNGDGFSDVLVVAISGALLYEGSPTGLPQVADWESPPLIDYTNATSAGDVNGDGYGDVLLSDMSGLGRIDLYFGSASGLASTPTALDNDQATGTFGYYAVAAGDVNGDSLDDLLVSAVDRIQLHLGNEGRGSRLHHLQQRRPDDSAPISALGKTDRTGLFRLEAEFPLDSATFAWSRPRGTTAHFEWELQRLGVAFDGLGLQRGPDFSLETGGNAALLDELVSAIHLQPKLGLVTGEPVHWRVRVATDHPFSPRTPWFGLQGNSLSEAKLRAPKRTP